ncbi:MAG: alpha/beta fold hydrolase [Pikeienuella sp.]
MAEGGKCQDHRIGAPSPLIMHLASALALYEGGARLAPIADEDRFPWPEPPDAAAQALAEAVSSADRFSMALALRAEAAARLSTMATGIRRYQQHSARRNEPTPPTIWSSGAARLLDYGPPSEKPQAPPVFVTPSLINRYYIMDLARDASLIGALRSAGLRPLVLDWGAPGPDEQAFDLTDYCEQRLLPAFLAGLAATGAASMPVIGYCMGGTLSVALAQHLQGKVSRLALIGAPWDFSGMTPMRGALSAVGLNGRRADLEQAINGVSGAFGAVPVHMLQMIFALLDPGLAARKFRRFATLDQDSAEAHRFVLIEDWLNDGPPFSGPAAREALINWHAENQPMKRRWQVFGERTLPESLLQPTLIIAATGDRIAPPAATMPLARLIPNATVITPATGHVGMIVGREAREAVWAPLSRFLLSPPK